MTTPTDLPALPESDYVLGVEGDCYGAEDRLLNELAYTEEQMRAYARDAITAQSAEIARLTAEVEGLRKDAERYRWLRDHSEPGICAFYLSVGEAFKGVKFARETVDEAIDAQIAAMKEQTNG